MFIFKLLLNSSNNLLINGYFAIPNILKLNQQTIYNSELIHLNISEYGFIDHFYIHKYNISIILLDML